MVPANSTITFVVAGTTNTLLPADATNIRSRISDRLGLYFTVLNLTVTPKTNLPWILDWEYAGAVTIKTRLAYAESDDIRSVIVNAFYEAAGAMPTVTIPAQGEQQGPAVGDSPGLPGSGIFKDIADRLQVAETTIILGILGIVALIVFSPAGREAGRSIGHIRAI